MNLEVPPDMKKFVKQTLVATTSLLLAKYTYQKVKEWQYSRQLIIGHEKEQLIPTLMLHGVNGNKRTMQGMIQRWHRKGLAYKALEIEISETGEMFVNGTWNKNQDYLNPIIQVFFDNNNATALMQAQWLLKIMEFLKQKLEIDEIYMLGHSMGGAATLGYLTQSTQNAETTPRVKKFVALGSPFKGEIAQTVFSKVYQIEKEGRRDFDKFYDFYMEHRYGFPRDLHVLNIYGDLDNGTESDGIVETRSSAALKDIVDGLVQSYEEHIILGLNGQHTLLHENSEVDKLVADFFWPGYTK